MNKFIVKHLNSRLILSFENCLLYEWKFVRLFGSTIESHTLTVTMDVWMNVAIQIAAQTIFHPQNARIMASYTLDAVYREDEYTTYRDIRNW